MISEKGKKKKIETGHKISLNHRVIDTSTIMFSQKSEMLLKVKYGLFALAVLVTLVTLHHILDSSSSDDKEYKFIAKSHCHVLKCADKSASS